MCFVLLLYSRQCNTITSISNGGGGFNPRADLVRSEIENWAVSASLDRARLFSRPLRGLATAKSLGFYIGAKKGKCDILHRLIEPPLLKESRGVGDQKC